MTPEQFEESLKAISKDIQLDVQQLVATMEVTNNAFEFNNLNLDIAVGFSESFKDILKKAGYLELLRELKAETDALLKDYIADRNIVNLTKTEMSVLNTIKKINYAELMQIGEQAGDVLQTNVLSAVMSGKDVKDVYRKLKSVLDNRLQGYANTYVRTAERVMLQKVELDFAKHFKNPEFEYVGPRDRKNRPECVEGLRKKIFTEEEMQQFEATYGIRWNCRHIFQVVSDGQE